MAVTYPVQELVHHWVSQRQHWRCKMLLSQEFYRLKTKPTPLLVTDENGCTRNRSGVEVKVKIVRPAYAAPMLSNLAIPAPMAPSSWKEAEPWSLLRAWRCTTAGAINFTTAQTSIFAISMKGGKQIVMAKVNPGVYTWLPIVKFWMMLKSHFRVTLRWLNKSLIFYFQPCCFMPVPQIWVR